MPTTVIECRSRRTLRLVRYLAGQSLTDKNGCEPNNEVIKRALDAYGGRFFSFLDTHEALLDRLLSEATPVNAAFSGEYRCTLGESAFGPIGMARPEFADLFLQFDRLEQKLEQCRLSDAISIENYHGLVRKLDGSMYNAFRRLKSKIVQERDAAGEPTC